MEILKFVSYITRSLIHVNVTWVLFLNEIKVDLKAACKIRIFTRNYIKDK